MISKRLFIVLIVLMFRVEITISQQPNLVVPVGHTSNINTTVYSPDGKLVLSYGSDPQFYLWDPRAGKLVHVFSENNSGRIIFARFSPDGRFVISQSTDTKNGNTVIWNILDGKIVYRSAGYYDFTWRDNYFFPAGTDTVVLLRNAYDTTRAETGNLVTGSTVSFEGFSSHSYGQFVGQQLWIFQSNEVSKRDITGKQILEQVRIKGLKETLKEGESRNGYFSESGKYLLVEEGNLTRIFEMATGDSLLGFLPEVAAYSVYNLYPMYGMSKDEKTVTWVARDSFPGNRKEICVYNLESRQRFSFKIQLHRTGKFYAYQNIPQTDGRSLFTVTDTVLKKNGKPAIQKVFTQRNLLTRKKDWEWVTDTLITGFSFSEKFLVCRMEFKSGDEEELTKDAVAIFNREKGQRLGSFLNFACFEPFSPGGDQLILIDNKKQQPGYSLFALQLDPLQRFPAMKGHIYRPETLAFPDSEHVFTGDRLIDIRTGKENIFPGSYWLSNETGTFALYEKEEGSSELIDVLRGARIGLIPGQGEEMDNVSYLVTSGEKGNGQLFTALWDYRSGEKIKEWDGEFSDAIYDKARDTLKYLVILSKDSTPTLFDILRKRQETLNGKFKEVTPNKKFIITTRDTLFRAYAVEGGQVFASGSEKDVMAKVNKNVLFVSSYRERKMHTHMENNPDIGRVFYSGGGGFYIKESEHDSIIIRSVIGNREVLRIPWPHLNEEDRIFRADYFLTASDDHQLFFVSRSDDYLLNPDTSFVIDLANNTRLPLFLGNQHRIIDGWFSADNRFLFLLSSPSTVNDLYRISFSAWDLRSGTQLAVFEGFNSADPLYSLNPDAHLLAGYSRGKIRIYDLDEKQLLFEYLAIDNGGNLVMDTKGRYDGSPETRKLLYFTCDNEVIELDQVKDQLWVPRLAERILKKDSINAKSISDLNICGLTPEVDNRSGATGDYFFRITPRRGGLGETLVFVNGIEVMRIHPAELLRNGDFYELRLRKEDLQPYFVSGYENPVTIKAFTADNTISSRGAVVTVDQSSVKGAPPNLYAVMVGVSDYKGSELDLNYAAKDATDLSRTLAVSAGKLLNIDGKEHVFMYNLTTSTGHYLMPEKNGVKKVMEEIGKKATANDILLFFFAGHGVMTGEAEKKQFYFLTADASSLAVTEAIREVGISTSELIDWMKPQRIRAQKRILIFDACNSGQAINDIAGVNMMVRNDDRAQQIKAVDKLNEKSGLFILSASASTQSAYEMGRYSQGLLTYSLLKAVKQQPEVLEDGKYLNLSRWFNEAGKTVSELSRENGARQEPQIATNTNFNIGVVDGEVMAKIVLPEEKPLFSASSFQNSDVKIEDDNLELSRLVNLRLSDIASRGTDNKIIYVTATNSPDAYSLSGRYDVKGNNIIVRVNVKQNREIKFHFEQSGTRDKLETLAAAIAEKAAGLAAGKAGTGK